MLAELHQGRAPTPPHAVTHPGKAIWLLSVRSQVFKAVCPIRALLSCCFGLSKTQKPRDLTETSAPAKSDTLLRHSRVHQSRRQERNGEPQASPGSVAARSHGSSTSVSAGDSACLSTAVTAAEHVPGPSAFGTTPQQQQLQLPNKNSNNGAMAVPNGYSVDGSRNSLDTIVASYSPITMPLAIVRENTPQSMIGHDARQCNLIPSWSPDGSLQWPPFDPFLATEEMDLEELSLSLLNATGEYPLQPVTIDAPISPAVSVGQCDTDLASDNTHTAPGQATVVQRSWHTFSGHAPSGYVTPNSRQEHDRLDDACHKNLEDRLQPRLQRGTLPSASFLVRRKILLGFPIQKMLWLKDYLYIIIGLMRASLLY